MLLKQNVCSLIIDNTNMREQELLLVSNEEIEIFLIQASKSQLKELQQEFSAANHNELDNVIQMIIDLKD